MTSDDNRTPSLLDDDEDHEEDTEDELEEEDEDAAGDNNNLDDEQDPIPTTSVTIALPPPIPQNLLPISSSSQQQQQLATGDSNDQARKLFQRLWTDEDEIGLLQGFLDYSTQRGTSQNNPHDTALFYDQIKSKLQLDFNKNQLVEKLRRLKKKYRNVLTRISSGKEISFKSPHDQATLEIATKIWGTNHTTNTTNTNLNLNFASHFNSSHHSDRDVADERKSQHKSSKKRFREKNEVLMDHVGGSAAVQAGSSHVHIPIWPSGISLSTPIMAEEKAKHKISPMFYDRSGGRRGFVNGIVSPVPLSFANPTVNMFGGMETADDRWRKQQILELEVYSKRLELVQEQINLTLEQLRSKGS